MHIDSPNALFQNTNEYEDFKPNSIYILLKEILFLPNSLLKTINFVSSKQLIPNGFQDEGFIKMNNFCLRRDEKVKDSRVTLQLFWQCIRQKEIFLLLILMFFYNYHKILIKTVSSC